LPGTAVIADEVDHERPSNASQGRTEVRSSCAQASWPHAHAVSISSSRTRAAWFAQCGPQ